MKKVLLCLLLVNNAHGEIIVTSKKDSRLIAYNDSVKAYNNHLIFKKNAINLLSKCRTREQFFHIKDSLKFDDCLATYKNGGLYKNGYKYEFYWEALYDYRGAVEAWYKIITYPKVKVIYKPTKKIVVKEIKKVKNTTIKWYTNNKLDSIKSVKSEYIIKK